MTLRNPIETTNAPPTDESLVDYLLGEAIDSDAIERWLAVDESHLLRLERLAEVVYSLAVDTVVPQVRSTNVWVLSPLSQIDAISDSQPLNASVPGSRVTWGRLLMGLATFAAAIALIVVWSRQDSDQRMTNGRLALGRLALVWADVVSDDDLTDPLAVELSGSWPADVDVLPADTPGVATTAWSDDEPIAEGEFASGEFASGEFASGDDSPPQWLLVAVSQMTVESPIDPTGAADSDVFDEEEVR
jgi:hypothetical protein